MCLFQDSEFDVVFQGNEIEMFVLGQSVEMCVCFRTVRLKCVFQDSDIEMCVCFSTVSLRCLFQDSEIEMCVCFRTVRLRCWLTSVTCRRSLTSCVCTLVTPTSSLRPVSRSSWMPQGLTASPGHSRYSAVFCSLCHSHPRGWSRRLSSFCV